MMTDSNLARTGAGKNTGDDVLSKRVIGLSQTTPLS
jgi:hypothetical protein